MTTYQFETKTPTVTSYTGGKEKVVQQSKIITGRKASSSSRALKNLAQAEKQAAEKQAEQKALEVKQAAEKQAAEQKKIQDQLAAKRVAANIETQRQSLISAGAYTRTTTSIDKDTRAKLEISTTQRKVNDERIFEVKNLETGEITTRSYAKKNGTGKARFAGGITVIETPKEESKFITELNKAKIEGERKLGYILKKPIVTKVEDKRKSEVQLVDKSMWGKISDLPSKAVEKITGKKPREVFRQLVGSQETDITKPLTVKEVVTESTQVPIRATSILGAFTGKAIGYLAPKEGIEITTKGTKEKEISFKEEQFGTISDESPSGFIKRKITIPAKPERTTTIFERSKVEEGVKMGVEFSAIGATPIAFAPGFVTSGVQTALDTDKTITERALGAAEAGLGGYIIGSKVVKYLKAPIVEVKQTRAIKEPKSIEVQKVIQINDKPKTVSLFEITGEVRPPMTITETTRGRQALDFIGKRAEKIVKVGGEPVVKMRALPKVTKIPAKKFVVKTPFPIIEKQPFIVSETISGRKFATISRIEGVSKKLSIEEFNRLTKQEQFLLQRRAMELTGRQVSLKQVPTILSKDTERTVSLIKSQKLVRIKPGERVVDVKIVPGKRRPVLSLAVSDTEKLGTISSGEVIKTKTLFKDITFEGSRRAGKTPGLETTVLKLKPKPSTVDEVKFIKPADIKKTPISKTFQTQQTESITSQMPLPKPEIVKPSTTILEQPLTKVEKILPTAALGVKQESMYAGLGKYEITSPEVISYKGFQVARTVSPDAKIQLREADTLVKTKVKYAEALVSAEAKLGTRIKETQAFTFAKSKLGGKEKVVQQSKQQSIQLQTTEKIFKQQSKQLQEAETMLSKQFTRPQQQIPKPQPIIIKPESGSMPKRILKQMESEPEKFEAVGFRFGKEVSLGKGTKKQTATKLSKFLSTTLGASGYLKTGGKKIKASETGLLKKKSFRAGKKDPFKVVEKKAKRLKKGTSETKEIQYFKRKSKKKK